MNIGEKREILNINKKVATKNDTLIVEGEIIVPDTKPDVLNTIGASGVICINKKEVMDGKIKIDGKIDTYIMYMPGDAEEKVRGIKASIDLSEILNISECTSQMDCSIKAKIKTVEAKVLNERKIGIKANVELNIDFFSEEELSIITDVENSDNVKVLKTEASVNTLIGKGETKLTAKDNISIESTDNLAEILKLNIDICNKDIKTSYNKVLTKAEAKVKIVYLTEDNKINRVVSHIPIVGFVDIENMNENSDCDVFYEIKNIIIKPNSVEEHSIYVEIEIVAKVITTEEKKINVIEDLYSPYEILNFSQKKFKTIFNSRKNKDRIEINEKLRTEMEDSTSVIDVDVTPIIEKENVLDGKIMYEGDLQLDLILYNNEEIKFEKIKLPFQYNLDNVEKNDNTNVEIELEVVNEDYKIETAGNVETNIEIDVNSNIYSVAQLNTIDEIESEGEREEEDYNVVMYIVKKGDTLWKIAKKFGSVIDDIVRVNGIENPDEIYPGDKIYIPRFTKKYTQEI